MEMHTIGNRSGLSTNFKHRQELNSGYELKLSTSALCLYYYSFFKKYILLIMLLLLSHSAPPFPLCPAHPLPPAFSPLVHVHGSYI